MPLGFRFLRSLLGHRLRLPALPTHRPFAVRSFRSGFHFLHGSHFGRMDGKFWNRCPGSYDRGFNNRQEVRDLGDDAANLGGIRALDDLV